MKTTYLTSQQLPRLSTHLKEAVNMGAAILFSPNVEALGTSELYLKTSSNVYALGTTGEVLYEVSPSEKPVISVVTYFSDFPSPPSLSSLASQ